MKIFYVKLNNFEVKYARLYLFILFKSHNIFTNMFTLFIIFYLFFFFNFFHPIQYILFHWIQLYLTRFMIIQTIFASCLLTERQKKNIKWFLLLFFLFCIFISVEIVTFQWYLLTRESYKESRKNRLRKSIVVLKSFFLTHLIWLMIHSRIRILISRFSLPFISLQMKAYVFFCFFFII